MRHLTTRVANQENAVVAASGVRVRNIGVGALHPTGEVGTHEQVQDAVDAVGCNALAPPPSDALGDVIGRRRLFIHCERFEDIGAHFGPLFASRNKYIARRADQSLARKVMMMVAAHLA